MPTKWIQDTHYFNSASPFTLPLKAKQPYSLKPAKSSLRRMIPSPIPSHCSLPLPQLMEYIEHRSIYSIRREAPERKRGFVRGMGTVSAKKKKSSKSSFLQSILLICVAISAIESKRRIVQINETVVLKQSRFTTVYILRNGARQLMGLQESPPNLLARPI